MKLRHVAALALVNLALGLIPSCVQLCAQRITIRYDAVRDELRLLIHYDGVHEDQPGKDNKTKGCGRSTPGREQIPEFVRDGDILFFDWFLHVHMDSIRKEAFNDTDGTPPALRALFQTVLTSVKISTLGRYRDVDGRAGAAQLVVVSGAKDFLRRANAAISEALLVEAKAGEPEPATRRTVVKLYDLARGGHQWLGIDGHSITASFAVHPGEWARLKATAVTKVFEAIREEALRAGGGAEKTPGPTPSTAVAQILAAAPLSWAESGGQVTVRIGDPKESATLRFPLYPAYNTDLEEVLAREVPTEVDSVLTPPLLGKAELAPDSGHSDILEWGPPEERVRMLSQAAESEDPATKEAALERLEAWGKDWNRDHGVPQAPSRSESGQAGYITEWKKWCREMMSFPLDP